MRVCHRWALAVVVAGAFLPTSAWASGTYFMVELQGGVGESAYTGGGPGLAYGLSAGATLKFKRFPVRWYLLGNVLSRNTAVEGRHDGIAYDADRRELDVFASQRTVIPVWQFVRVYFETGLGTRLTSQTIRRREQLGPLSESSNQLLLVLALGLQARLTDLLSVGVRGEITPLDVDADVATFAADLEPEPNRLSMFVQVGVHF